MKNLIDLLIRSQNSDGSFSSNQEYPSLLFSSLILIELESVNDNKKVVDIKNKLSAWLLKNISPKNSLANFIILAALKRSQPNLVGSKLLSEALSNLVSHENQEGGPYGPDLGINIFIAYFLALNKVTLPKLQALIEQAITKNNFSSKIINRYLAMYLIAKFYRGPKKEELLSCITNSLRKLDTPHRIILLSALKSLGVKLKGPEKIKISSALEASLFLNLRNKIITPSKANDYQELRLIKKILNEAKTRFAYLGSDLKKIALSEIKRTLKTNKDRQMSLIAYYLKLALGNKGLIIEDDLLVKIGLANIFFWTAFIIYDDFWDEDESAIPSILPSANLYARHYVDFYSQVLPDNPEFKIFFHKLMDQLDAANTWETKHCRAKVINSKFVLPEKLLDYQNYENKFRPASGQILGPLVMLLKLGLKLGSADLNYLTYYFKYYLIAMQINDDAHDWLEDLKRGHLSTVVVMLISDWQKAYPQSTQINLISDLEKLQKIFWFQTIKQASQTALLYTKKSRQALNKINCLEDKKPLAKFTDIAENVAQEALDKQKQSLDILEKIKL
ncbi:MAG: hypothetical protein WCK59_04310 [Candidatus Falkowbacteria bacterium]